MRSTGHLLPLPASNQQRRSLSSILAPQSAENNPRRHSSYSTVDAPGQSRKNSFVPGNNNNSLSISADERRWSVASTGHSTIPRSAPTFPTDGQNYCQIDEPSQGDRRRERRGSVVPPSRAQSLTEQEMRMNLEVPTFPFPGLRRGSGNHLMVPDDDGSPFIVVPESEQGFDNRPTSPTSTAILQMHSTVRRHRSLPSPGFINQANANQSLENKNQTRSSSFRLPNHCQIAETPPDSRQERRGSVVPSRAQSLTDQEMRINLEVPSYNFPGGRRGSGNHLMVPDDESPYLLLPQTKPSFDPCRPTSPTSAAFLQMHSRVRRHRSLPSPGFTNPVPASPFAVKNQTRSSSFRRPHHRTVQETGGRLRVNIKKSKPLLGIAIEGGSNVPNQRLPRIISIYGSGAAFETQDLHVGHIILEVDCISTVNLPHHQIAQMIADAYYHTPHKDFIEFVVREKSKHEFDIRRSSFMLLNTSFE